MIMLCSREEQELYIKEMDAVLMIDMITINVGQLFIVLGASSENCIHEGPWFERMSKPVGKRPKEKKQGWKKPQLGKKLEAMM